LNRIAAPGKRQRSEFVRQAIRKAIRQAEYHAIREAYCKQPDSILDAGDWSPTGVMLSRAIPVMLVGLWLPLH
jgi:hypothetical protein